MQSSNMEVHGYSQDGTIRVTIDGTLMTVPDNMANRHRLMIADWVAAGNTVPPFEPPAPDLVAYAAQKRWEKETGGVEIGGMPIHTDDRSKSLIMGARLAAAIDPNFTTSWKAADGSFVTVNAATIIAISDAVLAHVADCFAIEAQVIVDISAETITTPAQIDAAFA